MEKRLNIKMNIIIFSVKNYKVRFYKGKIYDNEVK